ncbi:hypothetical protein T484DRAFT_1781770 [Baffinella frigidus]|nr:hypothetical protein T484DRAFT_1781770 [Cryptophyta sp. CCMP2293]
MVDLVRLAWLVEPTIVIWEDRYAQLKTFKQEKGHTDIVIWEDRYAQLRTFKQENGHTDVPRAFEGFDGQLGYCFSSIARICFKV